MQYRKYVVLADRNDLDDQPLRLFFPQLELLRQISESDCQVYLKELLVGQQAHCIIFLTMEMCEESETPLSKCRNVIVKEEEAMQLVEIGGEDKCRNGEIKIVFALLVRDELQNATFIGVMIRPSRRKTVLGARLGYLDAYDTMQAVADGVIIRYMRVEKFFEVFSNTVTSYLKCVLTSKEKI